MAGEPIIAGLPHHVYVAGKFYFNQKACSCLGESNACAQMRKKRYCLFGRLITSQDKNQFGLVFPLRSKSYCSQFEIEIARNVNETQIAHDSLLSMAHPVTFPRKDLDLTTEAELGYDAEEYRNTFNRIFHDSNKDNLLGKVFLLGSVAEKCVVLSSVIKTVLVCCPIKKKRDGSYEICFWELYHVCPITRFDLLNLREEVLREISQFIPKLAA